VGTSVYHDAGATAAQDLAFAMATGVAYLRAMERGGLSVEEAARQLVFQMSVSCNFFLAIAKLRAARRLWAFVVDRSGVAPEAAPMRLHVRPGRRSMTHRDPWVNLLRNTVCCFAGAVAGAESVLSAPFDAPLGQPSELGRRIARNTHSILQEESHLGRVVDPAGGSWYLERLTDDLARRAWETFVEVESRGGMAAALTSGWIGEQVDSAFAPRLRNIARRRDAVTGVSEFPNLAERPPAPPPIDRSEALRVAGERMRSRTPRSDLKERLEALRRVAEGGGDERLMDATVEAFMAGASVWEVTAAMRPSGGAGPRITPLAPHPYAGPFEALRDASDDHLARCGTRPRVFLANMGPLAHHTARTGYARSFFEAGGFEVIDEGSFADAGSAAAAFSRSGASIAVLCSSDALYPEFVPATAPARRGPGARTACPPAKAHALDAAVDAEACLYSGLVARHDVSMLRAGAPGESEAAYREAGVDRFIFIRCDVLETLRDLLREEGVLS